MSALDVTRRRRVFSGVQPTGKLHIGNYVGALSLWSQNQASFDNIFCVVDMHAITIPEAVNPVVLKEKTIDVAALYMACGIDPKKSTIFIQSHVPEHAELQWILNCVTPIGWLYRMTQFKAKSKDTESVGIGLLDYPVLQAADILLYDTDFVPVGEDQKQHIELARDIAQRFNNLFNCPLRLPEPLIRESGAKIMGLDDPEIKMSKSIGEKKKGHSIGLLDSPDEIRHAIMRATTDSSNEARFDHADSGVRNLLVLYEVLSKKDRSCIEAEFHGKGYGTLKKAVVEIVIETLRPIQIRYSKIRTDKDYIDSVLSIGAERARSIASPMIDKIKNAIGFVPYMKGKLHGDNVSTDNFSNRLAVNTPGDQSQSGWK